MRVDRAGVVNARATDDLHVAAGTSKEAILAERVDGALIEMKFTQ